MEEDVLIQNGLGRFFAAKLRSGVLFEIYSKTGNVEAGKLALAKYQEARERVGERWRIERITFTVRTSRTAIFRCGAGIGAIGSPVSMRIIAAMQNKLQSSVWFTRRPRRQYRASAIQAATGRPNRPSVHCVHTPPASFHPGQPLSLSLRSVCGTRCAQCCPSLLPSRQSGRALAIRGNATQPRWIRWYHSRGLHEFRLPLAVLLRASAGTMPRGSIRRSTPRFRINLTMRSRRGVSSWRFEQSGMLALNVALADLEFSPKRC